MQNFNGRCGMQSHWFMTLVLFFNRSCAGTRHRRSNDPGCCVGNFACQRQVEISFAYWAFTCIGDVMTKIKKGLTSSLHYMYIYTRFPEGNYDPKHVISSRIISIQYILSTLLSILFLTRSLKGSNEQPKSTQGSYQLPPS